MADILKLTLLLLFLHIVPSTAYSHSGRTDAQGGHINKETGEYHFHNKSEYKSSHAQQTSSVTRIIDGDTILVLYKGVEKRIRLIGIDTPESRDNKKALKDAKRNRQDIETIVAMGKRATGYVRSLVKQGDIVTIEFDVQKLDKYKRLLGYVYLSDGKMLNEEIVKAGYANVMTIPPNVKYKDRFSKAYKYAKERKVGLWE
jgi:micrococcal nuclease